MYVTEDTNTVDAILTNRLNMTLAIAVPKKASVATKPKLVITSVFCRFCSEKKSVKNNIGNAGGKMAIKFPSVMAIAETSESLCFKKWMFIQVVT